MAAAAAMTVPTPCTALQKTASAMLLFYPAPPTSQPMSGPDSMLDESGRRRIIGHGDRQEPRAALRHADATPFHHPGVQGRPAACALLPVWQRRSRWGTPSVRPNGSDAWCCRWTVSWGGTWACRSASTTSRSSASPVPRLPRMMRCSPHLVTFAAPLFSRLQLGFSLALDSADGLASLVSPVSRDAGGRAAG